MSSKKSRFSKPNVFVISLVLLLVHAVAVFADVKLPAVISDNMVLQRGKKVRIWGWAEPGEKVSVKGSWQWFGTSTKAKDNGKWMVKIQPPKAGGPYEIVLKGNNKITLKNILVGEVWVCSGQSNMQWSVRQAANPEQEVAAADYPKIAVQLHGQMDNVQPGDSSRFFGGRLLFRAGAASAARRTGGIDSYVVGWYSR
jgi:sialate O-acetylesterase